MNSLTSVMMIDPAGKESTCAQLVIDDPNDPFILGGVTSIGTEYTLSFWIMSETAGSIQLADQTFATTTTWKQHTHTFTATDDDLLINFSKVGTYYIYHLQLEQGNRATDWSPAPEDAEEIAENAQQTAENAQQGATSAQQTADHAQSTADSARQSAEEALAYATAQIQLLKDQIQMLVVGADGGTLMTQTDSGWRFDMGNYINQITNIENALGNVTEYVQIGKHYLDGNKNNTEESNVRPCIHLGESDSTFKARVTNTSFDLLDDDVVRTSVDKDGISTNDITSKGEFRQSNPNAEEGSGSFVWTMRQNGNYGITWKELTS